MKKRFVPSAAFLVLLVSVLSAAQLAAEDSTRGRLPDGRAFRTDAEGNTLVDYIAELELSVEALQRRVYDLDSQLKSRDLQISRLRQGQPATPSLVERDLVSASSELQPILAPSPASVDQGSQSALKNCSRELEQTKESLARKQTELTHARDLLHQQQIASLRTTVEQTTTERSLQSIQMELARLKAEQSALIQERDSARSAAHEAESRVALLERTVNQQKDKFAKAEPASKLAASRASLRPDTAASELSSPGSLDQTRDRAVVMLRGSAQTELNKLRSLLAKRDKLYERYNSLGGPVKVKPKPLTAFGERSVASMRADLGRSSNVHQVAKIRKEASQARVRVQDDIAFISRMLNQRR